MSKVRQLDIIKIQRKDSKKSPEMHQNFSEEDKKTGNDNIIAKDIKIYQKMKNKCCLSIEKDIMKCEKIKLLMFHNITVKRKRSFNFFPESINYLFISIHSNRREN